MDSAQHGGLHEAEVQGLSWTYRLKSWDYCRGTWSFGSHERVLLPESWVGSRFQIAQDSIDKLLMMLDMCVSEDAAIGLLVALRRQDRC